MCRKVTTAVVRDKVLFASLPANRQQGIDPNTTDFAMRDRIQEIVGAQPIGSFATALAKPAADLRGLDRWVFPAWWAKLRRVAAPDGDAAKQTEAESVARAFMERYAKIYVEVLRVAAKDPTLRWVGVDVAEEAFRAGEPPRSRLSDQQWKAFESHRAEWDRWIGKWQADVASLEREVLSSATAKLFMSLPQPVPVTPTGKRLASSDNLFRQGELAGAGYLFHEYYRPMTIEAVLVSLLAKTESDPVNQSLRVLESLGMAAGGLVGAGGIWSGFDDKLYTQLAAVTTGVFIPEVRKLLLRDIEKYIRHLGMLAFGTTERIPPGEPRDKYLFFPKGPIFGFGIDEYGVTCPTFIANIDNLDVSVHGLLVDKAHEFSSGIIDKESLLAQARNEGTSLRSERERELAAMQEKLRTYALNKLEVDVRKAVASARDDEEARILAQPYIASFIGVYGDKDPGGLLASIRGIAKITGGSGTGPSPLFLGTSDPAFAKDKTTELSCVLPQDQRAGAVGSTYVGRYSVVLNQRLAEGHTAFLSVTPEMKEAEAKLYDIRLRVTRPDGTVVADGPRAVFQFTAENPGREGGQVSSWSEPFEVQVTVRLLQSVADLSKDLVARQRYFVGSTDGQEVTLKLKLVDPPPVGLAYAPAVVEGCVGEPFAPLQPTWSGGHIEGWQLTVASRPPQGAGQQHPADWWNFEQSNGRLSATGGGFPDRPGEWVFTITGNPQREAPLKVSTTVKVVVFARPYAYKAPGQEDGIRYLLPDGKTAGPDTTIELTLGQPMQPLRLEWKAARFGRRTAQGAPALPTGLSLAADGTISGVPLVLSKAKAGGGSAGGTTEREPTKVVVTQWNAAGSVDLALSFQIHEPRLRELAYRPGEERRFDLAKGEALDLGYPSTDPPNARALQTLSWTVERYDEAATTHWAEAERQEPAAGAGAGPGTRTLTFESVKVTFLVEPSGKVHTQAITADLPLSLWRVVALDAGGRELAEYQFVLWVVDRKH